MIRSQLSDPTASGEVPVTVEVIGDPDAVAFELLAILQAIQEEDGLVPVLNTVIALFLKYRNDPDFLEYAALNYIDRHQA